MRFENVYAIAGPSTTTAAEGEVFSVMCNVKFDPEVNSASVIWDKNGRDVVADEPVRLLRNFSRNVDSHSL